MSDQEVLRRAIIRILQDSSIQSADIAEGSADQAGLQLWYRANAGAVGSLGVDVVSSISHGRYLIASLTKPVVSLLVVELAAAGHFYLNEPVRSFLPSFRRGALRTVTLRHLLTHSSGLPDMLPDNEALRARHATVAEFTEGTARQDPAFQPGHAIRVLQ